MEKIPTPEQSEAITVAVLFRPFNPAGRAGMVKSAVLDAWPVMVKPSGNAPVTIRISELSSALPPPVVGAAPVGKVRSKAEVVPGVLETVVPPL